MSALMTTQTLWPTESPRPSVAAAVPKKPVMGFIEQAQAGHRARYGVCSADRRRYCFVLNMGCSKWCADDSRHPFEPEVAINLPRHVARIRDSGTRLVDSHYTRLKPDRHNGGS